MPPPFLAFVGSLLIIKTTNQRTLFYFQTLMDYCDNGTQHQANIIDYKFYFNIYKYNCLKLHKEKIL